MNGPAESKSTLRVGFINKLRSVNVQEIPGAYCRSYLQHLLKNIDYYLDIYEQLFGIVQDNCSMHLSEVSMVDYGAGSGLLGLYAAHCGFKKVFLIDSDKKFVQAANELARQLNLNCDIIEGDVHELVNIPFVDAIVGTDVIEHIYNLQEMMHIVKKINPSMVTVFTTASNPANFFKVRKLMCLQRKDERKGNTDSEDPEYDHPPFIEMRRSIIKSAQPDLNNKVIDQLVENTRGMRKEDILNAVYLYHGKNVMPVKPTHPTNTSNPLTGSWTERILTIDEYLKIYKAAGFFLDLSEGFYNEHQHGFRGKMNFIFNRLIKILGISFAPYIILSGTAKD